MRRKNVRNRAAKRLFAATASRTHKRNTADRPMRGGYRI